MSEEDGRPDTAKTDLSSGSMMLEDAQAEVRDGGPYVVESSTLQASSDTSPASGRKREPSSNEKPGPPPEGGDPDTPNPQPAGDPSPTDDKLPAATTRTTKAAPKRARVLADAPQVVDLSNSKRILLRNKTTGKCADLPGAGIGRRGRVVTLGECNNKTTDNQLWDFNGRYAKGGPGGVSLFDTRNVKDGLCLDLPGLGGVSRNTKVSEYKCNGTTKDNQLWWLQSRGGRFVPDPQLRQQPAVLEHRRLGGEGRVGAPLEIRPCLVNDDHKWIIGK
ncbi:RICIN domain-containing protein [Streptomyces sp. NPDC020681]|uniref:RICIN domain-containing protein n=1 Tax=Streptomyces sp. NPDC020681 TaxID=3365083 RepID=UPI0037B96C3A